MQLAFKFVLLVVVLAYRGATASVLPGRDWYNDADEVHNPATLMPTDPHYHYPIISGIRTHSFQDEYPGIIHMPSDSQGSGMQNINSHLASPPVGSGMRTPSHPQGSGMQTPVNLTPVIQGPAKRPKRPAKPMDKNTPKRLKINKTCTKCRTRAVKCDSGRPQCGHCKKRNETGRCVYPPREIRSDKKAA